MKVTGVATAGLILTISHILPGSALCAEVHIQTEGANVKVYWPAALEIPGQGVVWPEYSISHSTNLFQWNPIAGKLRGISGRSGPLLSLTFDREATSGF